MKGVRASDLRTRSDDELSEQVDNLGKEIFNLRFQRASGQLENTARVRQVRREIARIKTILGERRRRRAEERKRMPKRVLQGVVVSHACDKTVIVRVERRVMHPVYKKFVSRSKKYAAHDDDNRYRTGDTVRIEECRPISKRKSWLVVDGPADAAPGRRHAAPPRRPSSSRRKPPQAAGARHDPDADQSRRRRQFRRAAGAVHQGARAARSARRRRSAT